MCLRHTFFFLWPKTNFSVICKVHTHNRNNYRHIPLMHYVLQVFWKHCLWSLSLWRLAMVMNAQTWFYWRITHGYTPSRHRHLKHRRQETFTLSPGHFHLVTGFKNLGQQFHVVFRMFKSYILHIISWMKNYTARLLFSEYLRCGWLMLSSYEVPPSVPTRLLAGTR